MAVSFFLVQVREFFLWHPGTPDSRASDRELTAKSGPKQHENAIILRLFIQVRTKAPEADSAAHSPPAWYSYSLQSWDYRGRRYGYKTFPK